MLLTARKYDAEGGERMGMAHYVVPEGTAFEKAMELADNIAGNARIPNYLIIQALAHIDNMSAEDGLFTEAVAQAISLTSSDAKAGMEAFLNRKKSIFSEIAHYGCTPLTSQTCIGAIRVREEISGQDGEKAAGKSMDGREAQKPGKAPTSRLRNKKLSALGVGGSRRPSPRRTKRRI